MPLENLQDGISSGDAEKKRYTEVEANSTNSVMLPCWASLVLLGYVLAVFWFAVYMDQRLPNPVGYNDTHFGQDLFIEERARGYLKDITNFGPRPIGSKGNKVLTSE